MIFNQAQKSSIASRISFLEVELRALAEFKKLDYKTYMEDRPVRRNVERIIENMVNALIDISKIVLADKAAGEIPGTYSEVIIKLATLKIIDFTLAEKLAGYVRLRNYLAHEYLDARWNKIKNFPQEAASPFEQFIEQVKKTIA